MKKRILTIGAIALNAILLASCNGAKDYSVKREDVKELSKEEVNETLASRPDGFEELYKVYSDNNIVSLKDTLTYEAEGRKIESSLIYDFETATYNENNYSIDELYDGVDLKDIIINGNKWYYHKDDKGKYIYDYINKNTKYNVSITSNDDDYCKVNDIVESLNFK